MATDSKDLHLRIRATDYSAQTTDRVVKSLQEMTKAQEDQLAAAKRGEVPLRALEKSYADIRSAAKALVDQSGFITAFERQADALEEAKRNADAAREAQAAFQKTLGGAEKLTKEQVKQQRDLAKAVKNADEAQLQAQNQYDRSAAKVKQFGVTAENAAQAQQQIVQSVNSANQALERQETAIDNLDSDIARSVKLRNDQAAAEKLVLDVARAAAEGQYLLLQIEDDLYQARLKSEKLAKSKADSLRIATNKAMEDGMYRLLAIEEEAYQAKLKSEKAQREATAALKQAAQQAEATARGYQSLGRATKSVSYKSLADDLRAVNDPTGAAIRNISGLEKRLGELGTTVNAIKGPIKDFRATVQGLEATQKAAVGIAAQIDAYRRQMVVLRAARTEYVEARNKVSDLAQQMRSGSADIAELSRKMTVAQAAMKSAATEVKNQTVATRTLRDELKRTGVNTAELASEEERLVRASTQAKTTVDQLTGAYKKYGAEVERTAKSKFKLFGGERTTLGFMQRLKGEVLALATAYIGLQGAQSLASNALEAFRTNQKLMSSLTEAFGGDAAKARTEMDYLMATANRIGVSFADSAAAYGKFVIAAQTYGMSLQETRFVFEKFAIASRNAGLSGSEFEGVLKSVEQMLNKGKIQAEELTGQLADRLPGAFSRAAAGAGLTTEKLTKLMESGEFSADYVINIAREFGKASDANVSAVTRLASTEARFKNALYEFNLALAEGGFVDAYSSFLTKLTTLLKGEDGKKLAQALSDGFVFVIDILKLLADNIETVKVVLGVLLGLGVAKWFIGVATAVGTLFRALGPLWALFQTVYGGFTTAATAIGTFTAGLGAATGAVGFLFRALGMLIRFIPGIGLIASGIWLAVEAYNALNKAKSGQGAGGGRGSVNPPLIGQPQPVPEGPGTADPGTGGNAEKRAIKRFADEQEKAQGKLDKQLAAARMKGAKAEEQERRNLIKEGYDLKREMAKNEIKDATELSKVLQGIDKQEKQALQIDEIKFQNENAKSGAAAADKRVTLAEQVKNELLRIEDELAKDATKQDATATYDQRMTTRVEAISHAYDKLKKTISQLSTLDKAAAAEASKKLNTYIALRQEQERTKVTTEEIAKLNKELDDQEKLRKLKLEENQVQYDQGLISQEKFLENVKTIRQEMDQAVGQAADNLSRFAESAVAAKAGLLSPTDIAEIRVRTTTSRAESSNPDRAAQDEANKAQIAAIDNLIARRTQAEELFKVQLDNRLITEDQYAERMNLNAELYRSQTLAQIEGLLQVMQLQRDQGLLEGTINAERLAALDAQIAKYQVLSVNIGNSAKTAGTLQTAVNNFVNSGIDQALDGLVGSLMKMAQGQESVADGFKNLGVSFLQFAAQFMMEIAKMIAKQLILNALAGVSGPIGGAAKAAGGVASAVLHSGGRVGAAGGRSRVVDPAYFANAPRFHDGGLPGLKRDEVPAILQTGEQVLARDDPNNILNAEARPASGPTSIRAVLVDDTRRISEAMQTAEGEQAVMLNIRKNLPTIKQMIRS